MAPRGQATARGHLESIPQFLEVFPGSPSPRYLAMRSNHQKGPQTTCFAHPCWRHGGKPTLPMTKVPYLGLGTLKQRRPPRPRGRGGGGGGLSRQGARRRFASGSLARRLVPRLEKDTLAPINMEPDVGGRGVPVWTIFLVKGPLIVRFHVNWCEGGVVRARKSTACCWGYHLS